MPLTDPKIRSAKPAAKPYKLGDERGLFLLVNPQGGKWWRLKYRVDGKEKMLSLGTYPDVSLKEARTRRDEAREQIARGIDPSAERKASKAAEIGTFEAVARAWFGRNSIKWVPAHADKIIRRFEVDVFPWIGPRPIGEITAPELLKALRRVESRGALETAHRALQSCGQVPLRRRYGPGRT